MVGPIEMTSARGRGGVRRIGTTAAALLLVAIAASSRAQPPSDACDAATALDAFPHESILDLESATSGPEDEGLNCGEDGSLWYALTPAADAEIRFRGDTQGMAGIAVLRGSCADHELVACEGLGYFYPLEISFRVCAGANYLFRFSQAIPSAPFHLVVDALPVPPDLDGDGDGVNDGCDNCRDVPNPDQANRDDDRAGDACDGCPDHDGKTAPGFCGCAVQDRDDDSDELPNCVDNCDFYPNPDQIDRDGDSFGDACDECPEDPLKTELGQCGCGTVDVDADGDETADCNDPCPADPEKTLPGWCGCGAPESDPDADGVPSCIDNCADVGNADQHDIDGDGLGNRCECATGGCVAGGGPEADDCDAVIVPPAGVTVTGETLRCVDGTVCDRSPTAGSCTLRLALCFGTTSASLPGCTPEAPRRVVVRSPSDTSAEDVLLALGSLPDARAVDVRTVVFEAWPAGASACTDPFELEVPLGEGRLEISTQSLASDRTDVDRFRLICQGSGE